MLTKLGKSMHSPPNPSHTKGTRVAFKRPSFLKKLKEQQRRNKADQKREERRARRQSKADKVDENAADVENPLVESPEGAGPEDEGSQT